jgi:hypothetical protein
MSHQIKRQKVSNTNRLDLDDYHTNLVSLLDYKVESYITGNRHNQALVDEANETRDTYIEEINACRSHNLSVLDKNQSEEPLTIEQLYPRFCFLVEHFSTQIHSGRFGWRLVSTDKYLTPGQIECFQSILKFMPGSVYAQSASLDPDIARAFGCLFQEVVIEYKVILKIPI